MFVVNVNVSVKPVLLLLPAPPYKISTLFTGTLKSMWYMKGPLTFILEFHPNNAAVPGKR